MDARHTLTIEPGAAGDSVYRAVLVFQDGTDVTIHADERERVIAKAQRLVQEYHDRQRMSIPRLETLLLDEFGEIVRDPVAPYDWSAKA